METLEELTFKTLKEFVEKENLNQDQVNKLIKQLPEIIPDMVSDMARDMLVSLKNDAPEMLKERRLEITGFERRLQKRWKAAFDLLEMFLVISFELGEEFNHKFSDKASKDKDAVFFVLLRLHARSCQIGFEVLKLIKSGFADAAHARWRTLYENAVVASLIAKYGQDLAECYALHDHIESYYGMLEYQKYCSILQETPFSPKQIKNITNIRDELIKRFGNEYNGQYGWAAKALGKAGKKRVLFSDLEEAADLSHLRPYYRMASISVHANTKGINFRLGIAPHSEPVLLAGPSDYGFADPASGTSLSIVQITRSLLNTRPSLDNMVKMEILYDLNTEIGEKFLEIQKKLEDEIKKAHPKK